MKCQVKLRMEKLGIKPLKVLKCINSRAICVYIYIYACVFLCVSYEVDYIQFHSIDSLSCMYILPFLFTVFYLLFVGSLYRLG